MGGEVLSHLVLERRMSSHTAAAYRHDLSTLVQFCGRRKLLRWDEIDNLQMRTFAAALHGAGLGPRSIQRRLSAVRTFYGFLMREGTVSRNPALDVRAPKTKKRLPATLDADLMGRLLAFRADDSLSARDKAIMELFYSSGLRLRNSWASICPPSTCRIGRCAYSARAARRASYPWAARP